MTVSINIVSETQGTIGVPLHVQSVIQGATNITWGCDQQVLYTVTLDNQTLNFTPQQNGVYNFTVTATDGHQTVSKTLKVTVGSVTPTPTPTPTPSPAGLVYDSNVQGKMNNGVKRFVKDREGNVNANGFGFTVNASGGGGINCLGNGQFNIEPAEKGNRRMYICACNYNGILEGEFSILDSLVRNYSIKVRSRHQYRDEVDSNAPDSKAQGGLGIHYSIAEQKVGFSYETVHGTNGGSVEKSLPKKLEVGKWYGWRYTFKDASSSTVNIKVELDYKDGNGFVTVLNITPTVPSVFFNKADFDTWSQFWLRDNNEGKIAQKNVKLYLL